ncbi:PAS domain-containing sensor histidine kinase [Micromonosporaceae bacterium Da 78-11]
MQIAAYDVGRLSRLTAGCAGVAVAVFGALAEPMSIRGVPPDGFLSDPAAALVPAGLALLLQVLPVTNRITGRVVRGFAYLLALSAAAVGVAALNAHPAAAAATVLAGIALACIDVRVAPRAADGIRYRVADPLIAGAAIIALVALVPRMFDPSYDGGEITPYDAGALLTLAVGTLLARPESGPLPASGPGATVRRLLPVLIAVPVIAALVSALAVRTGISKPAAAISTGAILAALAVLGLLGYLVRTLDGADQRQRRLVDELHERQDFAETLLQSMNEAVMVFDANHRVIDVNRRWRELTGHGPDEAVRFDPPPLPPDGSGDWLLPRVDGTDVPVLATMAAIPDERGAPRGYVATYVDIADRKRAEETLSDHAAELEQGNIRLREANAHLEAALAFKNDLTSMLTHDVAQPISSIASLAELLSADWADLPENIRLELATKIDKNTRRLIKMMNDLQLLFRLDMGSVTARRAPVPLLEVAESVTAASAAGDGDVEIIIDEELSALADRGHLTAVVQNLLTNALAYGESPVHLRATRRGDLVELAVQDSGTGIPEDLLPNLFGRFMRGAGLGLFIVRHLVEANGGTVRYEHAVPRGACLIVTLEAAPV